jgi:hypothetical protein
MVDLPTMLADGGGDVYVLWMIGGGIMDAAIGEGERHRGSSWLASE